MNEWWDALPDERKIAFVLIGVFVLYAFSASGRQRADEDAELRERLARVEGRLQLD